MDRHLSIWPSQSGKDEDHAQSRLHRGLRGGLDESEDTAQISGPSAAGIRAGPGDEVMELDSAVVQSGVGDNHTLRQTETGGNLTQGGGRGGGRDASNP